MPATIDLTRTNGQLLTVEVADIIEYEEVRTETRPFTFFKITYSTGFQIYHVQESVAEIKEKIAAVTSHTA